MYLASNILGGKPNTAIVDIRNQNNYILRDLFSELNLEIRSNILNPYFRDALLSTSAGWLEYASKFENIFGFETASYSSTGKSIIGDGNYNLLANNMLEISGRVDSSTTAASWQSMAGWLIYSYSKGYWSADSATITKLANTYIEITVKYGVACCHHTCANLDFSKLLMEIGTVSPEMKQKYSDILQSATLSDAVYNSNQSGDNTQGNSTDDSEKENTQTNGATDENNNGNSGVSNGIASVGLDSSQPLSHSSGSSSSSRSSGSSGASSSAGKSSDSYEVSKATSSSSSNSSSMPVYFVIAVIILVILFAAGYLRGKNKED